MRFPIILDDHGDIEFFPSVESAVGELEAVDIQHEEYAGYDAEGFSLELSVARGGTVRIRTRVPPVQHVDELRKKLISYLRRVGQTVSDDADLASLIHEAKPWASSSR